MATDFFFLILQLLCASFFLYKLKTGTWRRNVILRRQTKVLLTCNVTFLQTQFIKTHEGCIEHFTPTLSRVHFLSSLVSYFSHYTFLFMLPHLLLPPLLLFFIICLPHFPSLLSLYPFLFFVTIFLLIFIIFPSTVFHSDVSSSPCSASSPLLSLPILDCFP